MTEENIEKTKEDITEEGIPADANELLIRGNIKKFIEDLKSRDNAEAIILENKSLGLVCELISKKYDIVQLSNIALELLSKMPVATKQEIRYIG